jgi:chromosome segregation ATPase
MWNLSGGREGRNKRMALVTYEEIQQETIALKERVRELEADWPDVNILLATLKERIRELEGDLKGYIACVDSANAYIDRIEAENKRLRGALEIYAQMGDENSVVAKALKEDI